MTFGFTGKMDGKFFEQSFHSCDCDLDLLVMHTLSSVEWQGKWPQEIFESIVDRRPIKDDETRIFKFCFYPDIDVLMDGDIEAITYNLVAVHEILDDWEVVNMTTEWVERYLPLFEKKLVKRIREDEEMEKFIDPDGILRECHIFKMNNECGLYSKGDL